MIWKFVYTVYFVVSVVLSIYFFTFSREKARCSEDIKCNLISAEFISIGFIIMSIAIGIVFCAK